jgi:hypothetical protein
MLYLYMFNHITGCFRRSFLKLNQPENCIESVDKQDKPNVQKNLEILNVIVKCYIYICLIILQVVSGEVS